MYGDPHITTFDGKSYYFGGSGDFWILKSDGLNIQGRFEERENQCTSSLNQYFENGEKRKRNLVPRPNTRKLHVFVRALTIFFIFFHVMCVCVCVCVCV